MKKLTIPMLLMALALVVAACGGDDTTTADGDDNEGGAVDPIGSWILVEGSTAGTALELEEGRDITLEVFDEDGVLSIAGQVCNNYNGPFELSEDNSVAIGPVVSTMMACEPQTLMTTEAAYFKALENVETVSVTDGVLVLSGPTTELSYNAAS